MPCFVVCSRFVSCCWGYSPGPGDGGGDRPAILPADIREGAGSRGNEGVGKFQSSGTGQTGGVVPETVDNRLCHLREGCADGYGE